MNSLAEKLGYEQDGELLSVLKSTAFKGNVSDAQMTALLLVAQQYKLNPWTREIYAFPDKNNGIVPVIGVDGWSRIINENPQFDGMSFEQTETSCTCTIYRKDRKHPIQVTEYLEECKRGTQPWQSHPKRMLRHKAMIQCARLAFGYTGVYDQDEAERIVEEKYMGQAEVVEGETKTERLKKQLESKALEEVLLKIEAAKTLDELAEVAAEAAKLTNDADKKKARAAYAAKKKALTPVVEPVPEEIPEQPISEPNDAADFFADAPSYGREDETVDTVDPKTGTVTGYKFGELVEKIAAADTVTKLNAVKDLINTVYNKSQKADLLAIWKKAGAKE